MSHNEFVTGPPRCGKTTVLERTVDRLQSEYAVGGVLTPERRVDGERVGFLLRDLATGATTTLASVDRETGPSIGKYRVDVDAVNGFGVDAIEHARDADVVVIDEIAPMQLCSDQFVAAITDVLDARLPVLAAVYEHGSEGVAADLCRRDDVTVHRVTERNRDDLPDRLAGRLRERLRA